MSPFSWLLVGAFVMACLIWILARFLFWRTRRSIPWSLGPVGVWIRDDGVVVLSVEGRAALYMTPGAAAATSFALRDACLIAESIARVTNPTLQIEVEQS